jgi:translation initiation factor IF-1
MPREETLRVNARVVETLPNALYRVQIATGARGFATVHVPAGSSLLRVRPGDEVVVELMPFDATRGRIVGRQD